jgi:hypothetical protein
MPYGSSRGRQARLEDFKRSDWGCDFGPDLGLAETN